MSAEESRLPSSRIVERLRGLIDRDASSCAAISRSVGEADSWLSRILARELDPELERIEAVLERLGLNLRWFLQWVFEEDAEPDPAQVLRALCPDSASVSDPFLSEVEAVLGSLDLEASHADSEPSDDPPEIDGLSRLRFRDQSQAKGQSEAFVLRSLTSGPLTVQARANAALGLGVWVPIARCEERYPEACRAVEIGLRLCPCDVAPRTHAITLQRAAYLLRDWGEPRQALAFAESAMWIFAGLGLWEHVARTLTDRGNFWLQVGSSVDAEAACRAALAHLPESDWRNRVAAYQGMALSQAEQARFADALVSIEEALAAAGDRADDLCLGHLLWTKGVFYRRLEDEHRAAQTLNKAFKLICEQGLPVDIALVALDLARSYLGLRQRDALEELAITIQGMMPALRTRPIVDRVLMEFVRTARYGHVTLEFLERGEEILRRRARRPAQTGG